MSECVKNLYPYWASLELSCMCTTSPCNFMVQFLSLSRQDKIFNQLLTERVCPLIVKLFSPTSKYKTPSSRLSPTIAALLASDKPTFSLSVRLLRILNVLIREFYASLVRESLKCSNLLAWHQFWGDTIFFCDCS